MRKLDKTETLVTIDDMTYVGGGGGITKLTCIVVCVYISSFTQFAYFLILFELVNLSPKPSNAFILLLHVFAQRVTLTRVQVTLFTHYPIYNFSIY